MTDNDIIKALEFCSHCECNNEKTETECPLINMPFCKNYLRKQSLALINRQKAEIERLQREKYPHIDNVIKEERAEAIKEFAERLKEDALDIPMYGRVVREFDIEYRVKEMAGDN